MNRNLKALITTALFSLALTAVAQTTDPAAQPSATPQTNHKDPADPSKGQDLVNPATSTDTSPTAIGQDKSTGNNLTPKANSSAMSMAAHPDFQMLDPKNRGYVMASDVKDPWLKGNFSKCDADKDGKVTKEEYGMCSTK